MTNPLKKLPRDVLANVREFASDRVEQHPTAQLIQSLNFSYSSPFVDDINRFWGAALVVSGEALTNRRQSCINTQCYLCTHDPGWGRCRAATVRTLPILSRRYECADFTRDGGWSYYYEGVGLRVATEYDDYLEHVRSARNDP